jgi:hypothetical protein
MTKMLTHSKIVDPLYILHENFVFKKISFWLLTLGNAYLINVLMNLSFMDFLFHVPFFCTAAAGEVAKVGVFQV